MGGEKDAVPSPHGSRENGGVWEMGGGDQVADLEGYLWS